ncbi:MAG: hypothetical protein U0821_24055 [Chloroflexota bacterium]
MDHRDAPNGAAYDSPEWLPVRDSVRSFIEDLESVRFGGTVRVFCGEADPSVYNDPAFLATVRRIRAERNACVRVITGPILLRPSDGQDNGLLALLESGDIAELRHRRARYATGHFRVVETESYFRHYVEFPHPPLAPAETRSCRNFHALTPAAVHNLSLGAIDVFDEWRNHSVLHGSTDAPHLPLQATADGLRRILAEADGRKLVFKYLDEFELYSLPSGKAVFGDLNGALAR